MSKGIPADGAGQGDVLDWLHEQGKRRDDAVPEFDVEDTLRVVRAARDAGARDAGARDAGAVNFWTALSPPERGDVVSAARKQPFPAGTVLMGEGGQADTVMVLLDGRAKVSVGGRVIAERGPGDLIGEHGAVPDGVRSATVVTVEPVLALVMRTEDFAAFINEHPDVPDLVKQQVYDRLTDPPGP